MRELDKLERMFDRPEFRHVLPSFWLVAREYDIVPGSSESQLETIVVKDERPKKSYFPFHKPYLFLSFARLVTRGKPSNRSILDWVNRYGLLRKDKDDKELELPGGKLNQAPMVKEDFLEEAFEARSLLDLYTDLSEGGIDGLRRRIGKLRKDHDDYAPLSTLDYYFVQEWGEEADKVGQRHPSSFFPLWATVELENRIAGKLENVRPALYNEYVLTSPYGRYKPTPTWKCPDLISAMYLQLFLWMTNGLPMRRCAIPTCATPFPVTRKDKEVCSDSCRSNLRHYPELQKKR